MSKKITIKPASKKEPAAPAAEKPWKVLIVDDDAGVIMITEHILKAFTYSGRPVVTYSAQSFGEATVLYDQHPDAAVALIDVIMDTADAGLRLVKHIREECGNDKIQLVLRSGQPGHLDQRDILLSYSINDYLNKGTVTSQDLQNGLIRYLRNFETLQKIDNQSARAANMSSRREQAASLLSEEMNASGSLSSKLSILFHDKKSLSQDEQLNYIKLLLSCDEQMIYLLRDLIDATNLEKGALLTHPKAFAVDEVLHEILPLINTLHKELADDDKVALSITVEEALPSVFFDPDRCQQIILNLVINALKRTAAGNVGIQIKPLAEYVGITIWDTGGPLAQEAADRIRAGIDDVDASQSIRLGLSAIKKIAEQQHAMFDVLTFRDGCEFSVLLPLAANQ